MRIWIVFATCAFLTEGQKTKNNKSKRKKAKKEKISTRKEAARAFGEVYRPNCRFGTFYKPETDPYGTFQAKDVPPSTCWAIGTECHHGLELRFTAKSFFEVCTENPLYSVYAIYDDDGASRRINLCSEMPTEDFTIYGDWIYLNGSSTVLIEYKVDSEKKYGIKGSSRYFPREQQMVPNQFKVDWQCFTTNSSSWRQAIGDGWDNIMQEYPDMQERLKMKLHRIFTRLMIQVTMKDQCLSEPSQKTLKRIERAEDIDDWVKEIIRLIRERFSTCKVDQDDLRAIDSDMDQKTIRHLQFKQSQAKNLKAKAESVIEKFEKFSNAPTQSEVMARTSRRQVRQRTKLARIESKKQPSSHSE